MVEHLEKGKEKVTWMKLDVLLDSKKNVMKVKNALCGTPQVRDQAFDEKTSTVTIKVVCCSPAKVMDKLCAKGRGAIKRINTIDPPKPSAPKPKEAEKPKETEKPKEPEKPKPAAAQVGPSYQQVIEGYYYPPMTVGQPVGQPVYYCNWPSYNSSQPNGPYERVVPDSYGGNYNEEEGIPLPSCSIM
ncbi:hypothetical protein V5N11_007757 [Cardamine amara subsp. amara]|uniref:Uncharacterized protein n=1 Tax=Cardamine amara subsp. amara TaxID=228776 RepID=A0ABD0Z1U9_CARAN